MNFQISTLKMLRNRTTMLLEEFKRVKPKDSFLELSVDTLSNMASKLESMIDHEREVLMKRAEGGEIMAGQRVRLLTNKTVMRSEFGHGEWGTIATATSEYVRIHLDKYHSILDEWGNCLVWDDEDVTLELDLGMDEEGPTVPQFLFDRVETKNACRHEFSHLNDELHGEMVCTTCGESWMIGDVDLTDRHNATIKLEGAVAKGAELSSMSQYQALWDVVDGLTNYQLINQTDDCIIHVILQLKKRGVIS